jgi:hypothetical protein
MRRTICGAGAGLALCLVLGVSAQDSPHFGGMWTIEPTMLQAKSVSSEKQGTAQQRQQVRYPVVRPANGVSHVKSMRVNLDGSVLPESIPALPVGGVLKEVCLLFGWQCVGSEDQADVAVRFDLKASERLAAYALNRRTNCFEMLGSMTFYSGPPARPFERPGEVTLSGLIALEFPSGSAETLSIGVSSTAKAVKQHASRGNEVVGELVTSAFWASKNATLGLSSGAVEQLLDRLLDTSISRSTPTWENRSEPSLGRIVGLIRQQITGFQFDLSSFDRDCYQVRRR